MADQQTRGAARDSMNRELAGGAATVTAELLAFLGSPEAYAEPTRAVSRVETHISWVFLTDNFAYKAKKPVRFEFLDFSTLERRHDACDAEVRLNRRLAPEVYLGLTAVTRERDGSLRLGGSGPPVEWLVRMRRLPPERALDRLLVEHHLSEEELQRIARRLDGFYRSLPPAELSGESYRAEVEHHVLANGEELSRPRHGLSPREVARAQEGQLRTLRLFPEWFDTRVCDGRIVDGHGDLRPEHIYLLPEPVIIDCIEFNAELRRLDVVDELSFLTVECDMLGARAAGEAIRSHYLRASGDRAPGELLAFYESYRACVRAKVQALRATQLSGAEAERARTLAARYVAKAAESARPLGEPLLVVVAGRSGSGKSTVAAALGERLHLTVLSTDTLRRELLGEGPGRERPDEGRYSPENRRRVYAELLRRAELQLESGRSVVLDGTFLSPELRAEARELASRHGARAQLCECHCAPEVARARILSRLAAGDAESEADLSTLEHQLRQPVDLSAWDCRVDTGDGVEESLSQLCASLRRATPQVRSRRSS